MPLLPNVTSAQDRSKHVPSEECEALIGGAVLKQQHDDDAESGKNEKDDSEAS